MAENLIRAKQINQADLSGVVQNVIDSNSYEITYGGTGININDVAQINLSGVTINLTESIFNIAGTGSNIRPTINGTGFLLSGEASSSIISDVVYTSGDQIISGNKIFSGNLIAQTGFFGLRNILSGNWSVIGGGVDNAIYSSATCSVIGGGCKNITSGYHSSIGGGVSNVITTDAHHSVIAGGGINCLESCFSFIGGGCCHRSLIFACYSATVGGFGNRICSALSSIGGGFANCVGPAICDAVIGGGEANCVNAYAGTIGGGKNNKIFGTSSQCYGVTVGGFNNRVSGNASSVVGGKSNVAEGDDNFIGGGCLNCTCYFGTVGSFVGAGLNNKVYGNYSATVGGLTNTISEGNCSFIGGGECNCVCASYAAVLGGRCNVVQNSHDGAMVLGDGQNRAHRSYIGNSLTIDFISGVYFSDKKIFGFTPELVNVTSNFNITGTLNSDVVLANSATEITGNIVSGNATGFNLSIIQIGGGQIQITGSGSNVIVSSYNNQFRTAGQFATISLLHTGNNRYIMYGNTST